MKHIKGAEKMMYDCMNDYGEYKIVCSECIETINDDCESDLHFFIIIEILKSGTCEQCERPT